MLIKWEEKSIKRKGIFADSQQVIHELTKVTGNFVDEKVSLSLSFHENKIQSEETWHYRKEYTIYDNSHKNQKGISKLIGYDGETETFDFFIPRDCNELKEM